MGSSVDLSCVVVGDGRDCCLVGAEPDRERGEGDQHEPRPARDVGEEFLDGAELVVHGAELTADARDERDAAGARTGDLGHQPLP